METIQVAIANTPYSVALRDLLSQDGDWQVLSVETPDPNRDGVLVLDLEHLEGLRLPIPHPERVVLIASNEPGNLRRAWEAGVNSVVFDKDPMNTAILAIMAARLQSAKQGRATRVAPRTAAGGARRA